MRARHSTFIQRAFDSPAVRACLVSLALFFGTLLLFSRGVRHEFLDYDDPDYVTQNTHVHSGITAATIRWAFTTGDAGNWHPITWLSYALDWQLFGNNPHAHHAVTILIHALNAMLAFLVLRRLTGAFWTSALCAALWAWHPLRVESVAWVAERKDVLCAFFGLLTLWAYARFVEGRKSKAFYALAFIAFALGLMSKPMLVTLPFVLLLLDYWPLKRFSARTIVEKIPFFLLSAAACVVTYLVQKKSGAVVETSATSDRLANAAVSVAHYLRDFFWPFDLAVGYPHPAHWPLVTVAIAALVMMVITGMALWQCRRRPHFFVGWFWFLGMLMPVIGIVQVGLQARADRYTYLPMLGLQVALLWTLRGFIFTTPRRRLATAAAALILLGCTARTWSQLAVWQNSRTLFEHALAVTKDNYLAHSYLGVTLFNGNHLEEARVHFSRAVEIKPDYAAAHDRLGLVLVKLGQPREALPHYEKSLAVLPNDALTHLHFANVLAALDRDEEALSHYQKVLELKPDFAQARCYYADSLRALKRFADACTQYRRALAAQPQNADAYYGLGVAQEELEKTEDALASYREAIRLKPDFVDAQYNLGIILLDRNQPADAIPHFQAAVKSDPHYVSAFVGLGLSAQQLGHFQEAITHYEQALRLEPGLAGIPEKLAEARRAAAAKIPTNRNPN